MCMQDTVRAHTRIATVQPVVQFQAYAPWDTHKTVDETKTTTIVTLQCQLKENTLILSVCQRDDSIQWIPTSRQDPVYN
jgi:hypothetical protein